MITDKIHIKVKAGDGGQGGVKFTKEGKPCGGIGGNGGNVIFIGTNNLYDLAKIKYGKEYQAGNGLPGGYSNSNGANGEDVIVKVPTTTIVYDSQTNLEIGRITEVGQKLVVAKGGEGGLGNFRFRAGQVKTLKKRTPGKRGEIMHLILELNLSADVVFIGFPNAGKSSLLNALTNATAKVAPYPFTTLQPHLGVANELVLMDLPGLIEGTKEGKGLGTHFTRHTKNAKLVAHFVSLDNPDPLDTYKRMKTEVERIDIELAEKKEVILLTKSDMVDESTAQKWEEQLKKLNPNVLTISTFSGQNMDKVVDLFRQVIRLKA